MKAAIANRPNDGDAWDLLFRAAAFAQDRDTLRQARDRAGMLGNVNPDIGALASIGPCRPI